MKSRRSAVNFDVFGLVQDGGQVGRRKVNVYLGLNADSHIGSMGAIQECCSILL